MHRPEPAAWVRRQRALDAVVVQRLAPLVRHCDIFQAHTVGVVQESLAEFAGGDDCPSRVETGQLRRYHVVGEGAGTDHDRAVVGVGEGAQALPDA